MEYCSIASGSSGNCTFAGTENTSILIDAGISGKRIIDGLAQLDRKPEDVDAILLTHEHIDHIRSIGMFSRKYHIPVYATRGTLNWLFGCPSMGKLDYSLFHAVAEEEPFSVKAFQIEAFSICHDAAQPVGFRICDGKASFAVATDMGSYDEKTVKHLTGLDGILVEANHDLNMLQVGPYPYPLKRRIMGENGHMSNETAGRLLCEILHDGLKSITLGHLSKENNYAALAYATVASEITMGDNPWHADDFEITVASRDKPGEPVIL